jgi:hypothetical protein
MGGRVENEPEEVNAAKAVWLGSDDENNIIAKFLEKYEITDNKDDFVKSSEIENWTVVNKDISYRKFCQELKKYCTIHKHSLQIKTKKQIKLHLKLGMVLNCKTNRRR